MKTLLFYCQQILGIGHLVRSLEIVRGLTQDFQVYLIKSGEVIEQLPLPAGVEVINLPPFKTDSLFRELQGPLGGNSLEAVTDIRRQILLEICDRIHPDILVIELFPFGRRCFSTELIPLLKRAKRLGTKVVCSLRDIVVSKQDQLHHEAKVCKLMNRYFDLLLVHGDPKFVPLEASFLRVSDLNCPVHYTGYVVQPVETQSDLTAVSPPIHKPLILVSVGGGRFGHELLDCVAQASTLLATKIPHHIQMFTGPCLPAPVFEWLKGMTYQSTNLTVERYTPNLLTYMQRADLSISMGGYNTTLNVLQTGVRAMLLPFTGNDYKGQTIRCQRLTQLGMAQLIHPEDLQPERFTHRVVNYLGQFPAQRSFDLEGVKKTTHLLRALVNARRSIA